MKKKIVFIGNSIVAGYPWSRGKSFVSRVRDALKGTEENLPRPGFAKDTGFIILNKGVNGDTTAGLLSRFNQDVLDQAPDMVFILSGTNDFIYRDASPEEAFANMELMANLCDGLNTSLPSTPTDCTDLTTNKDSQSIITVYMTPLPVDAGKAESMWMAGCGISYPAVNRDLDNLSDMIRNSGRPYVDLNILYPEFVIEKGDADLAYLDGIHPMPEGYSFIAQQTLAFMTENADKFKL